MYVPDETINIKIRRLTEKAAEALRREEKVWRKAGLDPSEVEVIVGDGRIYIQIPPTADEEALAKALDELEWLKPIRRLVVIEKSVAAKAVEGARP